MSDQTSNNSFFQGPKLYKEQNHLNLLYESFKLRGSIENSEGDIFSKSMGLLDNKGVKKVQLSEKNDILLKTEDLSLKCTHFSAKNKLNFHEKASFQKENWDFMKAKSNFFNYFLDI